MPADFFDSNVLLYIASGEIGKADRAERLIAEGGVISVQVLNEVTNVARRKMHLSWRETGRFLSLFRDLLAVEPLTLATHDLGIGLAERYRLSTFDAMIAAAAVLAGCDRLWSEDMQNGLVIDGRLQIADPFRELPQ